MTTALALGVAGVACYDLEMPQEPSVPAPVAPQPGPIVPPPTDPGMVDARTEFFQNVEPILTARCGFCHAIPDGVGPTFLDARPDVLASVLAYPHLIGETPETSRLLTKGAHHGAPAFPTPEASVIAAWIVHLRAEQAMREPPPPPSPRIEPFIPRPGSNTIELAPLGPKFAGHTITFEMQVWSGTEPLLELTQISVHTAESSGLRIIHPLWSRWSDGRPHPDPADSFSNLDLEVEADRVVPLGPGILLFPRYVFGQPLNVAFESISTVERRIVGGSK